MTIKAKVLIVEDEQSISNFISMILTANGFDTIIVRTGEEALTMIASPCSCVSETGSAGSRIPSRRWAAGRCRTIPAGSPADVYKRQILYPAHRRR